MKFILKNLTALDGNKGAILAFVLYQISYLDLNFAFTLSPLLAIFAAPF
jgi:hypothetical protein